MPDMIHMAILGLKRNKLVISSTSISSLILANIIENLVNTESEGGNGFAPSWQYSNLKPCYIANCDLSNNRCHFTI